MCLNPYTKRNPNFGSTNPLIVSLYDTKSETIDIPCGHCSDCITVKQMYHIQRIREESRFNHLFFATITYNNNFLPKVILSDGKAFSYAKVDDIREMFDRLRHDPVTLKILAGRSLRMLAVSELGGKKGRPHFHLLFFVSKLSSEIGVPASRYYYTCLDLEQFLFKRVLHFWSSNVGTRKNPVYRQRLTYVRKFIHGEWKTNYDLHYVDPGKTTDGVDNVSWYVLKYMMKDSDRERRRHSFIKLNYDEDEFQEVWSLIRCRTITCRGFGVNGRMVKVDGKRVMIPDERVCERISSNCTARLGMYRYPVYINEDSGKSFPLSKYYRRFPSCFSLDQALKIVKAYVPDPLLEAKKLTVEHLRYHKENSYYRYLRSLSVAKDNDTFEQSVNLIEPVSNGSLSDLKDDYSSAIEFLSDTGHRHSSRPWDGIDFFGSFDDSLDSFDNDNSFVNALRLAKLRRDPNVTTIEELERLVSISCVRKPVESVLPFVFD